MLEHMYTLLSGSCVLSRCNNLGHASHKQFLQFYEFPVIINLVYSSKVKIIACINETGVYSMLSPSCVKSSFSFTRKSKGFAVTFNHFFSE